MRKIILLTLIGAVGFFSGCSCVPKSCQNELALTTRNFKETCFKVSLYSGGKEVRVFYAEYVNSLSSSDGWEFRDIEGRFVRISGDVVVEEVSRKYCFKWEVLVSPDGGFLALVYFPASFLFNFFLTFNILIFYSLFS